MKIRKYKSESLPKAIQKAKEELGEDIVLLESREVRNKANWNSKKMIEISVAVYEKLGEQKKTIEEWAPPKISTKNLANRAYKTDRKPAKEKIPDNGKKGFDKVLTNILSQKPKDHNDEKLILNEIADLRKELKQLSRKSAEFSGTNFPEPYMKVFNILEERGVDKNLAATFVQRSYLMHNSKHEVAIPSIINGVKSEMEQVFSPYDFSANSKPKQEVVLLLGSTGVGKSTTSMKLATHKDLYGKKKVGIISTDPYGPTTALRAFENITGISVVEAKTFEEIKLALETLQDKQVVIVDTPGSSPFAPNHLEKLEKYIEVTNPTDLFLVLSMTTDTRDLFLSCGTYLLLKPTGIIFTKFDETSQPGKVFSISEELNLPTVCYCEGERIFIDVAAGNIDFLYKKIFEIH